LVRGNACRLLGKADIPAEIGFVSEVPDSAVSICSKSAVR
jgi:hypothetical protein